MTLDRYLDEEVVVVALLEKAMYPAVYDYGLMMIMPRTSIIYHKKSLEFRILYILNTELFSRNILFPLPFVLLLRGVDPARRVHGGAVRLAG